MKYRSDNSISIFNENKNYFSNFVLVRNISYKIRQMKQSKDAQNNMSSQKKRVILKWDKTNISYQMPGVMYSAMPDVMLDVITDIMFVSHHVDCHVDWFWCQMGCHVGCLVISLLSQISCWRPTLPIVEALMLL